MLMLKLSDSALQDIADATGANKVEIEGTTYLEDRRIVSLVEVVKQSKQAGSHRAGFLWIVSLRLLPQHSYRLAASSAEP